MGSTANDRCPCCGYRTGCLTCPVCFWTDDGRSADDLRTALVPGGPNGDLTIADARLNFAVYGASYRKYAELVRRPRADELP